MVFGTLDEKYMNIKIYSKIYFKKNKIIKNMFLPSSNDMLFPYMRNDSSSIAHLYSEKKIYILTSNGDLTERVSNLYKKCTDRWFTNDTNMIGEIENRLFLWNYETDKIYWLPVRDQPPAKFIIHDDIVVMVESDMKICEWSILSETDNWQLRFNFLKLSKKLPINQQSIDIDFIYSKDGNTLGVRSVWAGLFSSPYEANYFLLDLDADAISDEGVHYWSTKIKNKKKNIKNISNKNDDTVTFVLFVTVYLYDETAAKPFSVGWTCTSGLPNNQIINDEMDLVVRMSRNSGFETAEHCISDLSICIALNPPMRIQSIIILFHCFTTMMTALHCFTTLTDDITQFDYPLTIISHTTKAVFSRDHSTHPLDPALFGRVSDVHWLHPHGSHLLIIFESGDISFLTPSGQILPIKLTKYINNMDNSPPYGMNTPRGFSSPPGGLTNSGYSSPDNSVGSKMKRKLKGSISFDNETLNVDFNKNPKQSIRRFYSIFMNSKKSLIGWCNGYALIIINFECIELPPRGLLSPPFMGGGCPLGGGDRWFKNQIHLLSRL
eukprot:GHVL01000050.1.p1 GENE.GHVL01000050.1~~GHVL01000050.1.p1  ORF type:complete len:550 (+),score=151.31 GHVL01000050.1:58-1707(+)